VRLFGKDPWAAGGVRTIATIERVMVSEIAEGSGGGDTGNFAKQVVYLTFRFTDEQGAVVLRELRRDFRSDKIPAPGWSILVVYVAGRPETLDYDPRAMRPPDPSVPRGWGTGIFEVEDLGTHGSRSPLGNRALDRQRELFRTGRREQAEVVRAEPQGDRLKRSAHDVALTLRAGGQEIAARAWVPSACVPNPGDLIQIAVSDDGSEVALDTDERYDGPPGQALVFTTPPELAVARPPIDVEEMRPWTPEKVGEGLAAAEAKWMAGAASQAPAAPAAPAQKDPLDELAQLGELLKSGAITQDEFAELKTKLLAG
jgi:hypothetical protein